MEGRETVDVCISLCKKLVIAAGEASQNAQQGYPDLVKRITRASLNLQAYLKKSDQEAEDYFPLQKLKDMNGLLVDVEKVLAEKNMPNLAPAEEPQQGVLRRMSTGFGTSSKQRKQHEVLADLVEKFDAIDRELFMFMALRSDSQLFRQHMRRSESLEACFEGIGVISQGRCLSTTVWRAGNTIDHRNYAFRKIKIEALELGSLGPAMLNEARALEKLQHENLARHYLSFASEDNKYFYMVMEFVPGGQSLATVIADPSKRHSEAEIGAWMYQLLSALHFLHAQGVRHQNLSAESVLLVGNAASTSAPSSLKVKLVGVTLPPLLTSAGWQAAHATSPYYAQSSLRNAATAEDVHAVGAILLEILTRKRLPSVTPAAASDDKSANARARADWIQVLVREAHAAYPLLATRLLSRLLVTTAAAAVGAANQAPTLTLSTAAEALEVAHGCYSELSMASVRGRSDESSPSVATAVAVTAPSVVWVVSVRCIFYALLSLLLLARRCLEYYLLLAWMVFRFLPGMEASKSVGHMALDIIALILVADAYLSPTTILARFVKTLTTSRDEKLVAFALDALGRNGNLFSSPFNQMKGFPQRDLVVTAVVMLTHAHASVRKSAAMVVGKLATNATCAQLMVDAGAIDLLVSLLRRGDEAEKSSAACALAGLTASANGNAAALIKAGAAPLLLRGVKAAAAATGEAQGVAVVGVDRSVAAMDTLSRLMLAFEHPQESFALGSEALPFVVQIARFSENERQRTAAALLMAAVMEAHASLKKTFEDLGGLRVLSTLLKKATTDKARAAAVRGMILFVDWRNRNRDLQYLWYNEGVTVHLVTLLRSHTVTADTLYSTVTILLFLMRTVDEGRVDVARADGVPVLMKLAARAMECEGKLSKVACDTLKDMLLNATVREELPSLSDVNNLLSKYS